MRKLICILAVAVTAFSCSKEEKYFKKDVKLDPTIETANYTNMKYIDTIVNVGLQELYQKNVRVVIAKMKPLEVGDLVVFAAVKQVNNNTYILYTTEMSREASMTVISHEVIHIAQAHSKRFLIKPEGVQFDNKMYPLNTPYDRRPWENEAFEYQNALKDLLVEKVY